MTNIRCKGKKEIDLLAIDPKTGQKFHVESRVWTNRRLNSNDLTKLADEKFNDSRVKEKISEFFGESQYSKWLVVSSQKVNPQLDECASKLGIEIWYIGVMFRMIKPKLRFGSRDQVLRILEIVKIEEDFDRTYSGPPVKKPRL